MYFYSVIIPVYNRPEEVDELLDSLTRQSYTNFEVLIIEDGSTRKCDHLINTYGDSLNIQYFFKPNTGQGFTRNFGFERAKGDYLVVFDSDCIIPGHYFLTVDNYLQKEHLDAFGGPDRAHDSFTVIQKAISYSMTSFFTTGGIRGKKKSIGAFHPRSFNMGISREVFEKTKGYIITRMGEDIEFSIRIINSGFKTGLIEDAYVYHKRRTNLSQFYKQLHFFGRARINIGRFFPSEIKLVHAFPALFTVAFLGFWLFKFIYAPIFYLGAISFTLYFSLIFADALKQTQSLSVAFNAIPAAFIQLFAYGIGFITEALFSRKS